MFRVKDLLPVVLAGLLGACGQASDDASPHVVLGTPVLPVDVLVLHDADGRGNPLWEPGAFARAVLDSAARDLDSAVTFVLESYATVTDPEGYALPQSAVLRRYRDMRVAGRLLLVISSPLQRETLGYAYNRRTEKPYVILRARWQDPTASIDTGRILLHELGHCQGYTHDSVPLHTDNYWSREDGRTAMVDWLRAALR